MITFFKSYFSFHMVFVCNIAAINMPVVPVMLAFCDAVSRVQ